MLWDGVVLSSDINFDKVLEKIMQFDSISPDARYYIINKESKDVLLSNVKECTGMNLSSASDPILAGIAPVFDSLNKAGGAGADKVKTVKTAAGSQMVAATDIEGTSWAVVSSVPS